MREITLTKDQYEHLPYKDTKLTKDDSFGAIVGLLRKNGIKRYMMDGDEDESQLGMIREAKRNEFRIN